MKRKQQNFLDIRRRFALAPIKTQDDGWTWMKMLWVVNDHRPVEYLGLLTVRKHFLDKSRADRYFNELSDVI